MPRHGSRTFDLTCWALSTLSRPPFLSSKQAARRTATQHLSSFHRLPRHRQTPPVRMVRSKRHWFTWLRDLRDSTPARKSGSTSCLQGLSILRVASETTSSTTYPSD